MWVFAIGQGVEPNERLTDIPLTIHGKARPYTIDIWSAIRFFWSTPTAIVEGCNKFKGNIGNILVRSLGSYRLAQTHHRLPLAYS